MMIAPAALASRMSLSAMAPTARWMISTWTSLLDSCCKASASASAGPPWSALMTRRSWRFWPAEAYHQEYYARNPGQSYCMFVVEPKVAKFRKHYLDRLKG
jgi:hypothetical protein